MAKRTKLKAGCGLVSVFLVGMFCGAFVLFFLLVKVIPLSEGWRDEESKKFVLNHLANRLKLTDEQIEKIRPIAFSALDERYARRKAYVDADMAITGKAFEEIREILDDAQEKKAEEMFGNWKKGKERFLFGEGEVKVK